MTNPLVQKVFLARAKAAVDAAASIADLEHNLSKGVFRELVVDQLLRPMLPSSFGIGTGGLVDHEGGQSGQIDLVIYNRNTSPPILFGEREGLYPIESCLYAIEVKSRLTKAALADIVTNARKVSALAKLRCLANQNAGVQFDPIKAVFAFSTELANKVHLVDQYVAIDPDFPHAIDVLCVVGRGYWFNNRVDKKWHGFPATDDHQEILQFVGGMTNTVLEANARMIGAAFGNYILTDGEMPSYEPELGD
jgi:hypothetical protein